MRKINLYCGAILILARDVTSRYNRGCIEWQRNHWRHRTSCCKREETRPKNKSHVVVIYWTNMTTYISSLNQDSITMSCFLTVSKQLERVSDLSKLTRAIQVAVSDLQRKRSRCQQNRQMWGISDCLNFRVGRVGVCTRSSWFILLSILLQRVSSFNNVQCLWWSTGLSQCKVSSVIVTY